MYQNGKLTKYNELTEDNKKVMDRMTIEDLNALRMEAIDNPDNKYYVTVIGTKLAGRSVEQMKDFFSRMNSKVGIPDNIILPEEFEVRTESVSTPSEFNFFKNFIDRFNENHPEFRNLEVPKTMTYYRDYLLSRDNVVAQYEASIKEVTKTPGATPQQMTLELPVDNSFALKDSFNSLREINNNLSKNC
jgi:hypothetical protein